MPFQCTCRQCGAALRVVEGYQPAAIVCPRCGSKIPNPAQAPGSTRNDSPTSGELHPEPLDGGLLPEAGQELSGPVRPPPNATESIETNSPPAKAGRRRLNPLREYLQTLRDETPRLWVTAAIVAINVAVYVLMSLAGAGWFSRTTAALLDWGGTLGPRVTAGQWWRLLTASYIHAAWWHILLNMLVLMDVGRLVERLLGHLRFFVLYTLAGVLGSMASVYVNPYAVGIGASGAIFGVAGGLGACVLFAHERIPPNVAAHLRRNITFFVVLNFAIGLSISFIDNSAHLGGLAAGFLLGLILRQPAKAGGPGQLASSLLAVVCGAAVLIVAVWRAPQLVDPEREYAAVSVCEQQAITAAHTLWDRHKSGALTNAAYAEALERDVLPGWSEGRERLGRIRDALPRLAERFELHWQYFSEREEACRCLIDGLRGNGPRMQESLRHTQNADRLLHQAEERARQ